MEVREEGDGGEGGMQGVCVNCEVWDKNVTFNGGEEWT